MPDVCLFYLDGRLEHDRVHILRQQNRSFRIAKTNRGPAVLIHSSRPTQARGYTSGFNSVSVFLTLRESRRKTPTTVCLKENERLFGDGALGMVR